MESALKKGSGRKGRKQFFFEKKNQKTFPGCFARVAASAAGMTAFGACAMTARAKHPGKVFWFFFSKKNRFLFLALRLR
jgi:hypothetical protein